MDAIFSSLVSSRQIMCFKDSTSLNSPLAVCKNCPDTIITVGLQSSSIDLSSYLVSFISSGTVIIPASTEAKTPAPNSGLDSDKIASRSPLVTPIFFIR